MHSITKLFLYGWMLWLTPLMGGTFFNPHPATTASVQHIDYILVEKKQRRMSVFYQNQLLKTYNIDLGFAPLGDKQQEGDGKTPEGIYYISYKNPHSKFYLSLRVSYPNKLDKEDARQRGVSPGGDIMIHGYGRSLAQVQKIYSLTDWTEGCIAVTNEEIQEVYKATAVGTVIEIRP